MRTNRTNLCFSSNQAVRVGETRSIPIKEANKMKVEIRKCEIARIQVGCECLRAKIERGVR